jgi:hypothetical protein
MKDLKLEDLFEEIYELRMRLSLEGSGEIDQADYIKLDRVLDTFEFINDHKGVKEDFENYMNIKWENR